MDEDVASKIINEGYREQIPEDIRKDHPTLTQIIEECWDQDPKKRPSAIKVHQLLKNRKIIECKNIENKITNYIENRLKDDDANQNLTNYITTMGTYSSEAIVSKDQAFNLEDFIVDKFILQNLYKLFLILAPAGTGKTTFLQAMERKLLQNKGLFTIYVNLQTVEDINRLLLTSLIGFAENEIEEIPVSYTHLTLPTNREV